MRSAVRKFAVVAGVVVAATLVAVPGAEAAPVTTCPGTELHKEGLPKPLKNQLGEQAGTLRLWYSSANGGTNCAKVYDDASGSHSMSVSIRTDTSATVTDSGTFSTFMRRSGGDRDERPLHLRLRQPLAGHRPGQPVPRLGRTGRLRLT